MQHQQQGGSYYPHLTPSPPAPSPNPPDLPSYASAPPFQYPSYPHTAPSSYLPDPPTPDYPHLQPPLNPPHYYPSHDQGRYPDPDPAGYTPDGYRLETSGYAQDYYGAPTTGQYLPPARGDDFFTDGVYAYDGGSAEPYGARGTKSASSWAMMFDDYGRPMGESQGGGSGKVVRAVPKAEERQDASQGVQKFRVKLLPEGAGAVQDVLCQVGLDGIRMLDPSTSRMLKIYPLDTIVKCQVLDSSIFAIWAKSSVDLEPRRIRLQSNSHTSNIILDTVTAASVQYKEMGGKDAIGQSAGTSDSVKPSEHLPEKKKGLIDWINRIKPVNEEKDHWVPDEAVSKCTSCGTDFNAFVRRHHCRNCGDIFCDKCTSGRVALTVDDQAQPVRVCDGCLAEVTQRLIRAQESSNKSTGFHSHEDLAKKLQEEMERNRKASVGSKSSGGSGGQMREVACPTCTVHLQVQLPSSGSETIECGVCQNPFLVSAR